MVLELGSIYDEKDMIEKGEMQKAEEFQRILVLILRTAQGHHTHKLKRSSKEQRSALKLAAGFNAKYGDGWKALVKRILDNWTHPIKSEEKKDLPLGLEEQLSRQLVNKGTRLSDAEKKGINHILEVAERIIANTNDYFSWEFKRNGDKRVANLIQVIMEKEGSSEEEAREKLKIAILDDETKYQLLSNQVLRPLQNAPANVRIFLAMLDLLIGGHHVWSATCERYKVHSQLDVKEITIATTQDESGDMSP
ncbi:geranylgeranyl pyrophosphate synthase [Penicillium longicatenatum]|uniref:geranylgeranyl pyrophosphate synthase n=1 Tax=Penicillium longicatenatum TaxID=1561947 RepID=UPI002549B53E|nr:geranylgeranyl pyrophosphate synthase [Penicillium longicatenatum]KAJ5635289.1 geranylgeranyl pyrophosphate synthase [Penicillium longicatenatum]